jgi:hypothetical protein
LVATVLRGGAESPASIPEVAFPAPRGVVKPPTQPRRRGPRSVPAPAHKRQSTGQLERSEPKPEKVSVPSPEPTESAAPEAEAEAAPVADQSPPATLAPTPPAVEFGL